MNKLKLGLFGVGHLGKIHLKCILESGIFDIMGFYDPNDAMADEVVKKYEIKRFLDTDSLIDAVEVVDIVTPTLSHFDIAKACLSKRKHFFVEKPLTHSLEQAEELIALAHVAKVKAQVGHVERFNPAFLSIEKEDLKPMFIEAHRLSSFSQRGTDVSVVLDLMIHDIDIILNLVDSKIKSVNAVGVSILSKSSDICNARLEFENGCIANLTASRMALKQMRKLRIFQNDAYLSLDFLAKKSQKIKIHDSEQEALMIDKNYLKYLSEKGEKFMSVQEPEVFPVNAIKMELESLHKSIIDDKKEAVSLEDGYEALKLAHQILDKVDERNNRIASIGHFIET